MGSTSYLRASLVSTRFSSVHHKGQRCLIPVCNVFDLVYSTSSDAQHFWKELRDWITQTLWIFLYIRRFSPKGNFETVGKSREPLIRTFSISIWIKFFNKLLCLQPPKFDCFPLIPCFFIIIVQCLFHQWKPRSTTSAIWSTSMFLIHWTFTFVFVSL